MACLDDNALAELVEGTLSAEGAAAVHVHLDGCIRCRRVFSELARGLDGASLGVAPRSSTAPGSTTDGDFLTAPPPLPRGATLDRYVVLELLGRGAMGTVYAAYDPKLHRNIALKLLHRDHPFRSGTQELIREAQAIARLNHPNVVAVHDVGTFEERVFLTMELVEGSTLRRWAQTPGRTWEEILSIFVQAGEGLAAAHAAGIVHRDFKPENVLVGVDGRARVLDFGLAQLTQGGEDPNAGPDLSANGVIAGTPAYMAPELRAGARADGRSDQYSFCVALYEALHGRRPGDTPPVGERRRAKMPGWLDAVLARGLSEDPSARFPSLSALLEALRGAPRVRRRRMLTVGAAALVGLGAAVGWRATGHDPCAGSVVSLRGVWDAARRSELHRAFVASGQPRASERASEVAARLDRATTDWVRLRSEACGAALAAPQAQAAADQMLCLEQWLVEVRYLVEVLSAADGETVERAGQATGALSPPSACLSAATRPPVQPPADEQARERAARIRERLAEAKALAGAGKHARALPIAEAASSEAAAIGDRPLQAEALFQTGRVQ